MKPSYVLDTNAYALLFQLPRGEAYANLEGKLKTNDTVSFYIPEIVSMEIHSVLGKFRRGGAKEQRQACSRKVYNSEEIIACGHVCYVEPRPRMKPKVFKALQKLLKDIERKHGSVQADLLPLGTDELNAGKEILSQFAHRFSFGSHDALVAGTVLTANQNGMDLILVTSDKGLKAVCREQGIPHYDPASSSEVPL